ncbi:DUF2786 domain-containing protein [Actinorhabdospora filicis]|uniref:DUF2786 domain-containing protein n=1 Tax=Actinorhabdospora filicis TaxID=1785913 RepID=UPI002557049E|nr:DUF2786 domain-containing protein [Actinorhabdospora filicis]
MSENLVTAAAHRVLAATDRDLDLALDLGASTLAASEASWPGVGRQLLAHAESELGRLWDAGWRPADLARVARRELAAVHVALAVDLIAAEGRRHAPAVLDRRWLGELRELSADVWWDGDDAYLPGFAAAHRLDRFAIATAVLELLRVWGLLPVITPVGAAPGGAPRRASEPVTGDSPMLARIRALLAKAESTDFPQEAEALTGKAQELMARHSIDEARLAAGHASPDAPAALRIGVDAPYDGPKTMLLDAVADANRCRAVWSKEFGFCTVIGFDADLDAVDLLYTSLLVQATAAMSRAGDAHHRHGAARTKSFRHSFLVAYATRIRERLSAATESAVEEAVAETADSDLLPVLAAREEKVDKAVDAMFGRLRSQRVRVRDGHGWAAGREAADRAALRGSAGAVRG